MLYGTAEFRKNFYIKLRQMTGIIFRAPDRIDATRVHARASAKRATGSGVRFGSKADICSAKRHVRFTPKSGHLQRTSPCPLCANSGHAAHTSLDHLVGGSKQRWRNGQAERLCCL